MKKKCERKDYEGENYGKGEKGKKGKIRKKKGSPSVGHLPIHCGLTLAHFSDELIPSVFIFARTVQSLLPCSICAVTGANMP